MKLYGAAQAGGSLQAVLPGQRIILFDGTETPAALVKSLAFVPVPGPTQVPSPIVFTTHFGAAPTATVLVQAANADVEAQYQTVFTSTNKQDDYYADAGGFAFYRVQLSAYVSGGMPVVIAQR